MDQDNIVQNYINGNLSTFRKQIERLSKSEFLEVVMALQDAGCDLHLLSRRMGGLKCE